MTRPKPNKSDSILDAATALFASRPFHEVRLDDIAAGAHVGKGTVYLYWSSKEEVYLAIIRRGFAAMVAEVERQLSASVGDSRAQLWIVITAIVDFAFAHPGVYRIMRSGSLTPEDPEIQRLRKAFTDLIERVLTAGVAAGQFTDPAPAITAQFLLSFARGAILYAPPGMTPDLLKNHIAGVLLHGIAASRSNS